MERQNREAKKCRSLNDRAAIKIRDTLPNDLAKWTGKRIKVAVIDSGVHPHWLFARNIKKRTAFEINNGRIIHRRNVDDKNGHGTKICEVILSIAPDAELYIARIFGDRLLAEMDCLVEGIRWAIRQRVHIINISLGSTATKNLRALKEVCMQAANRNIFVISSMDNANRISYPGYFRSVFCVYNPSRNEIRKKKKYLLGFGDHFICPNSFLVPVASGILSLIREAELDCAPDTAFGRLRKIIMT